MYLFDGQTGRETFERTWRRSVASATSFTAASQNVFFTVGFVGLVHGRVLKYF